MDIPDINQPPQVAQVFVGNTKEVSYSTSLLFLGIGFAIGIFAGFVTFLFLQINHFNFELFPKPGPDSKSEINYDPELARKTLSQIANNISVPYLDLQEAIVGAGKFEDLYFPLDRHWKPEGHVVAARTVADFIIKKDLLK
jgi:hypothetical protein